MNISANNFHHNQPLLGFYNESFIICFLLYCHTLGFGECGGVTAAVFAVSAFGSLDANKYKTPEAWRRFQEA